MSPPAGASHPRRPPTGQRFAVSVIAIVLVAVAWLFAGKSPLGPDSTGSTPSQAIATDGSLAASVAQGSTQPSASAAGTELIVFAATADAYVFAGRPELNYGTQPELRVDADPENLTYLLFEVSGIHGPVLGASLLLNTLGRLTQGFQVRSTPTDWAESNIIYGSRPTPGPDVVGTSGLVAAEKQVRVKLTIVPQGDGAYSFVLFTTSTTGLAFASREAGFGTAPKLILEVAKGGAG